MKAPETIIANDLKRLTIDKISSILDDKEFKLTITNKCRKDTMYHFHGSSSKKLIRVRDGDLKFFKSKDDLTNDANETILTDDTEIVTLSSHVSFRQEVLDAALAIRYAKKIITPEFAETVDRIDVEVFFENGVHSSAAILVQNEYILYHEIMLHDMDNPVVTYHKTSKSFNVITSAMYGMLRKVCPYTMCMIVINGKRTYNLFDITRTFSAKFDKMDEDMRTGIQRYFDVRHNHPFWVPVHEELLDITYSFDYMINCLDEEERKRFENYIM